MKYCSNCGAEIDEKAVICVKCGVPVSGSNVSQPQNTTQKSGHGGATASLVLGIIGLVFAIISLLISLGVVYSTSYVSSYYYDDYSTGFDVARLISALLIIALPGILSLIGLPIGIFCKRGSGAKIAGIILNAIAILICAADVIMIVGF